MCFVFSLLLLYNAYHFLVYILSISDDNFLHGGHKSCCLLVIVFTFPSLYSSRSFCELDFVFTRNTWADLLFHFTQDLSSACWQQWEMSSSVYDSRMWKFLILDILSSLSSMHAFFFPTVVLLHFSNYWWVIKIYEIVDVYTPFI